MGVNYIWDTNTVIYYLQELFPLSAEKFIDETLQLEQPSISAITEIELLCWRASKQKDIETLQNFIDNVSVIELEQPIKLKTAEIRKNHKTKLPDAIIAATAIVYNLTLITRNIKDFSNIDGLKVIDPFNL